MWLYMCKIFHLNPVQYNCCLLSLQNNQLKNQLDNEAQKMSSLYNELQKAIQQVNQKSAEEKKLRMETAATKEKQKSLEESMRKIKQWVIWLQYYMFIIIKVQVVVFTFQHVSVQGTCILSFDLIDLISVFYKLKIHTKADDG